MKIPFSPPDITEAEIEQVAEALRSGWITTGPKTKELEREVADLCGISRAVCLNSQTACAEMTLRLLGIGEGDEVITCAYTYTAMMTAYKNMGFDIKDYPNAYKRFENEITLPLHTKLTDEEVEYVIEMYCGIVKEYIK